MLVEYPVYCIDTFKVKLKTCNYFVMVRRPARKNANFPLKTTRFHQLSRKTKPTFQTNHLNLPTSPKMPLNYPIFSLFTHYVRDWGYTGESLQQAKAFSAKLRESFSVFPVRSGRGPVKD